MYTNIRKPNVRLQEIELELDISMLGSQMWNIYYFKPRTSATYWESPMAGDWGRLTRIPWLTTNSPWRHATFPIDMIDK